MFESSDALNEAFIRFKELADKKHEIFDEDLQALVTDVQATETMDRYRLESLEVTSKTGQTPISQVSLWIDGEIKETSSKGSGPVDATYKAIEKLVNSNTSLQLYSVNAITSGTDSQGEVIVRLEKGGRIVNGLGADTDIVIASAKAYIHALNTISSARITEHPQKDGI